jgi:hypothetical protein
MSIIDGLTGPTLPLNQPSRPRAPDLALLRELVQPRQGWRATWRRSPPPHELVNRLLVQRDRMLRLELPRVRTTISVFAPNGRRAVSISV